ncbi:shikimate dehydrogenase [Gracilibacillus halophilus YIM-C55.5]|uniref:Shikimate dehydrogenase (NADP(+)) n=1 Tax=Gracilibacillus halophilus YIM-C55.5 TaxID=1308866 RepID=N4WNA2_9BACI|nr:shikimate dehydrogenase [Gracilibacillus halophilus]ENH97592.1 shikimate dehydrogenase [Gracilibacillus halophilus YIM-C55.5]
MAYKLGLIGHPIEHSLSPWIHQQFMDVANIDGEYKLYEGDHAKLPEVIQQLRDHRIDGFNVTVPYKQVIIDYIDELDPAAKALGAVNTVVNQNGTWKGYSTDGEGYVRSMKEQFPSLLNEASSVLILGAGGAARGIYRAFIQQNVKRIDIANRSEQRANGLLELRQDPTVSTVLTLQQAESQLNEYDLIIQTTSVGMKPNTDEQIIRLDHLHPDTIVSDIVYQPITTALLKDAKQRGAKIHHGHAMLLYQAQLAFEKWTGTNLDVGHLVDELERKLRGE